MKKIRLLVLNLCLMLSITNITNRIDACDEVGYHHEAASLRPNIPESNHRINSRLMVYDKVTLHLESLTDNDLLVLLTHAQPVHSGVGGTSVSLEVRGAPIFAKKIPLTDIEKENARSTANLFELPPYYQYGIGSAGFNAWREWHAHIMTTQWVRERECQNFPLMYHWRMLPDTTPKTLLAPNVLDELVKFWGGSSAIRARHEAIQKSSTNLVLFLEYIPQNLEKWLDNGVKKGCIPEEAITMVEHDLKEITSFIGKRGLLHFDAHLENILTDGHRLYLTDFGLATSLEFDLSGDERDFIKKHRNYDQRYTAVMWVDWIASTLFGDNTKDRLHDYARGEGEDLASPLATSIIRRDAQNWIEMDRFYEQLKQNKTFLTTIHQLAKHSVIEESIGITLLPNPHADLQLSIYAHTLMGSDVWLRPIFPGDYRGIVPIYTNPKSMQYFSSGKVYTKAEVRECASRWASRNLALNSKQHIWSIISHQGIAGYVATFTPQYDNGRVEIA